MLNRILITSINDGGLQEDVEIVAYQYIDSGVVTHYLDEFGEPFEMPTVCCNHVIEVDSTPDWLEAYETARASPPTDV